MTNNNHKKILVAMDTPNIAKIRATMEQVGDLVGGVKLGLEFFNYNGVDGLNKVMERTDNFLFLDLKFHDIPNTVAGAVRGAMSGVIPNIMTVQTSGGLAMMKSAKDESVRIANELGVQPPLIVGVTILTALDDTDLKDIGYSEAMEKQVVKLAKLAKDAGLDGVVCSPLEIETIKQNCGNDFITVVPGIRPEGADNGDQKRVMTPAEAIEKGADYLVIGRPITESDNPKQTCEEIKKSIDN